MNPEDMTMVLSRLVPAGILTMLVGVSVGGGAYHIDYDQNGGNPADEWTTMIPTGLVTIICESQGPNDKVNDQPAPHEGVGGLCYAASQDFADCDFMNASLPCSYNKTKEKDKKPFQNETHADWGMIEPKCTAHQGEPGVCPLEALGYFIRINSNTRSCFGDWGMTFAYKESVAYWGGSILNNATGASGHVTFFVDEPLAEGTYNRAKNHDQNYDVNDPEAPGPIENPLDVPETLASCTGNASSWGLMTDPIGKKAPGL